MDALQLLDATELAKATALRVQMSATHVLIVDENDVPIGHLRGVQRVEIEAGPQTTMTLTLAVRR